MSLHLVCGDGAADALRRAVEAGVLTEKKIRVMPDDLAVGPLSDVDTQKKKAATPCRTGKSPSNWPPK